MKSVIICDICYEDGQIQHAIGKYITDAGLTFAVCENHAKTVIQAELLLTRFRHDTYTGEQIQVINK